MKNSIWMAVTATVISIFTRGFLSGVVGEFDVLSALLDVSCLILFCVGLLLAGRPHNKQETPRKKHAPFICRAIWRIAAFGITASFMLAYYQREERSVLWILIHASVVLMALVLSSLARTSMHQTVKQGAAVYLISITAVFGWFSGVYIGSLLSLVFGWLWAFPWLCEWAYMLTKSPVTSSEKSTIGRPSPTFAD